MIVAIDTNCVLPGEVGGIESYTVGLIEALKLAGSPASKLVLITRPENHEFFESFADSHTQAVLIDRPKHKGKTVRSWSKLLKKHPAGGRKTLATFQQQKAETLERLNVDLIHFPGNTINPLDLGLPVVLNLHDLGHRHFPEYFSQEEIDDREKWWAASAFRADSILTASSFVRRDLQQQLRVDASKIFVAPEACPSFIPPTAANILDVRERFGLSEQFFIYPADVLPHRNHERLIRAFISAELGGAQLILSGGGQKNSQLPELIEELHAEFNVRLVGRLEPEDARTLYHLATGLVFPSGYETWSTPVMEAMASGCPIACSNAAGLPDEVVDAALLFDPDNQEEITSAIQRLAGDPSLRQTLAKRGRERVKEFGPEAFLRAISAAYEHAQSRHRFRKAA
jgi:glycosyltransferase involved in cell wall biosynthesis